MDKTIFEDERVVAIEVTPMWSGKLPIRDVDEALKLAGVPEKQLPRAPARAHAMKRAFDACSPRGARIDMLPNKLGVTLSLKDVESIDLEQLSKDAGTDVRTSASYHAQLTAKIHVEEVNGVVTETLTFSPSDHPMVQLVQEVYATEKETYKCSEELSQWFSQTIIPLVSGIGKRSRGGVYYVPAKNKELLFQIQTGLELVSSSRTIGRTLEGKSYPIQLLDIGGKLCMEPRTSDDSAAMEIVVDGVVRNADSVIDDLTALVEASSAGAKPIGLRGLKSKRREAAQLEEDLARWEASTSTNLDLVRNRLNELKNVIGIAEIAAEAAENAKV